MNTFIKKTLKRGPMQQPSMNVNFVDPEGLEGIDLRVARAPGVKLDSGKPDMWYHLFDNFPDALEEVALHSEAGDMEEGHTHHGWRSVPDGYKRYSAALLRHMLEGVRAGDDVSKQILAARAAAWNALVRLQLLKSIDTTCEPNK